MMVIGSMGKNCQNQLVKSTIEMGNDDVFRLAKETHVNTDKNELVGEFCGGADLGKGIGVVDAVSPNA